MRVPFRILGFLTLLMDTYLVLSLVAFNRMSAEYLQLLPPFGDDRIRSIAFNSKGDLGTGYRRYSLIRVAQ